MAKKKKSMRLGGGGRFQKEEEEARESGARDPKAVAAAIGRKKYGNKAMTRMAVRGKRRSSHRK